MTTIDLIEFLDYDSKKLYAWLLKQQETVFHIRYEKAFSLPDEDQFQIAIEYEDAMLFGEKLSAFSDDFGYYTASELSSSPFAFDLVTGDMEQLADTLFFQVSIIANKPLEDEFIDQYNKEKTDFWDKYCNGEIEPVCKGLQYIVEKIFERDALNSRNQ